MSLACDANRGLEPNTRQTRPKSATLLDRHEKVDRDPGLGRVGEPAGERMADECLYVYSRGCPMSMLELKGTFPPNLPDQQLV